MATETITIILLAICLAVLMLCNIVSTAEGDRFDEIDISNDIIDYDEWDELHDEIERQNERAGR